MCSWQHTVWTVWNGLLLKQLLGITNEQDEWKNGMLTGNKKLQAEACCLIREVKLQSVTMLPVFFSWVLRRRFIIELRNERLTDPKALLNPSSKCFQLSDTRKVKTRCYFMHVSSSPDFWLTEATRLIKAACKLPSEISTVTLDLERYALMIQLFPYTPNDSFPIYATQSKRICLKHLHLSLRNVPVQN